ncbi:Protease 3 precursor [Serratia fonticola]|uniref:Protease 3 n=1 Tax=Serratia fonticola TaxID=47917 RepID=A0A4U9V320_SERFO|nr:Protease 3 precursor [Serratia fonticola]
MLQGEGIKQSYFDEIAHVLNLDFRYPSITRDMNYIEWLVDYHAACTGRAYAGCAVTWPIATILKPLLNAWVR